MREQTFAFLKKLDIPYRFVEHPPVFRVGDVCDVLEEKEPVKSLLLMDRTSGILFLVIAAGLARLDLKLIASNLGVKKLNFANETILMDTLGVAPGSVSVFCLLNPNSVDVSVYVDEVLYERTAELGFHPGDNEATVFIPTEKLPHIIEATGHSFQTMKLY